MLVLKSLLQVQKLVVSANCWRWLSKQHDKQQASVYLVHLWPSAPWQTLMKYIGTGAPLVDRSSYGGSFFYGILGGTSAIWEASPLSWLQAQSRKGLDKFWMLMCCWLRWTSSWGLLRPHSQLQ